MYEITAISALKDNYIWLIRNPENNYALVVDPGDAAPVLAILENKKIKLAGILITHHHWDHTDGIKDLVAHFPVQVYGPAHDPVPFCTQGLSQDDRIHIPELNVQFQILDIPGHTKGHIAFFGLGGIFCGDTLFSAGCGRIFEGTAKQMFDSLNKLARLPEETFVYCAHEYTENNLQFAQLVDPQNPHLQDYFKNVRRMREKKKPTLPSTIKIENQINPFLRCKQKEIRKSVENYCKKELSSTLEVFTELRKWKNQF